MSAAAVLAAFIAFPIGAFLSHFLVIGYPLWHPLEFVGIALVLGPIGLALVAGRRLLATGVRFGAIALMVVILAQLVYGTKFGWDTSWKARCGAWQLKQGSALRAMGNTACSVIYGGEVSASLAVESLGDDRRLFEVFQNACGSCSYDEVVIGRYTLADYFAGRVTLDELAAEAELTNTEPRRWERMGNIVVCRDPRLWNTHDASLITGYAWVGGPFAWQQARFNVLFADVHVEVIDRSNELWSDSIPQVLQAVVVARHWGYPEPPTEFLRALGISENDIVAFRKQTQPAGQ